MYRFTFTQSSTFCIHSFIESTCFFKKQLFIHDIQKKKVRSKFHHFEFKTYIPYICILKNCFTLILWSSADFTITVMHQNTTFSNLLVNKPVNGSDLIKSLFVLIQLCAKYPDFMSFASVQLCIKSIVHHFLFPRGQTDGNHRGHPVHLHRSSPAPFITNFGVSPPANITV